MLNGAGVTQLVEYLTRNEKASGSNPLAGSNKTKAIRRFWHFAKNAFVFISLFFDKKDAVSDPKTKTYF